MRHTVTTKYAIVAVMLVACEIWITSRQSDQSVDDCALHREVKQVVQTVAREFGVETLRGARPAPDR
jgi:hypothetical protein